MTQNPFDALGGGGFDMNALLQQAYVHRDQVALLAFRGETAELALHRAELARLLLGSLTRGGVADDAHDRADAGDAGGAAADAAHARGMGGVPLGL